MKSLNEINKTIQLFDYDDNQYLSDIREELIKYRKSLWKLEQSEGLSFSVITDCVKGNREVSLRNLMFEVFEDKTDELDFYERDTHLSDYSTQLKRDLFQQLRIDENQIIVLETGSHLKDGDLKLLIEIDKLLTLRSGFSFLIWVRRDWNEYYRRKFYSCGRNVPDADFVMDTMLGEDIDFENMKRKISMEILPSKRKTFFYNSLNQLNEFRRDTALPSNIYNPRKRSPELYEELLEIHHELSDIGYWKEGAKLEEFYQANLSSRKQLERKVNLLRYILNNTENYDFLL